MTKPIFLVTFQRFTRFTGGTKHKKQLLLCNTRQNKRD